MYDCSILLDHENETFHRAILFACAIPRECNHHGKGEFDENLNEKNMRNERKWYVTRREGTYAILSDESLREYRSTRGL